MNNKTFIITVTAAALFATILISTTVYNLTKQAQPHHDQPIGIVCNGLVYPYTDDYFHCE